MKNESRQPTLLTTAAGQQWKKKIGSGSLEEEKFRAGVWRLGHNDLPAIRLRRRRR